MAVSNPAMVVYRDGSVIQKIIKKTKELNTAESDRIHSKF